MQERNSALVRVVVAKAKVRMDQIISSLLTCSQMNPSVLQVGSLRGNLAHSPQFYQVTITTNLSVLTALSKWEAFFSLSKRLYKSSWQTSSERLVYLLKNFSLSVCIAVCTEQHLCISSCLCITGSVLQKHPFYAPNLLPLLYQLSFDCSNESIHSLQPPTTILFFPAVCFLYGALLGLTSLHRSLLVSEQ